MPPKKTKSSTSRSPAPKDLKRKKSNAKIIFFGLFLSVGLIMLACFLDYQQSKLMNHTSMLPREVQVATKYMVDLANEVPHKLEILLHGAKGQMIIITGNMHIGDKTVAQLLFGVDEEKEDPTPADVIEDFKLEEEVEGLIDELNTDEDDQILEEMEVEEIATLLRKEEEMRVYEENRRKMKEETLKAMEAKREALKSTLMEEKEKATAENEEILSRKVLDEDKRKENGQINDEVSIKAFNTRSKVLEKGIHDIDGESEEGIDSAYESKKYKEDEAF